MRYNQLINKIDQINASDPNRVNVNGKAAAKEVIYSQRMLKKLLSIDPNAPEELKIAVYAQHINRWKFPRKDYPSGRQGYLKWRTDLARYHARLTGELMAESGYTKDEINRVSSIIQKKNLKTDSLAQQLEDVACLVFLEYYLAAMMESHDEEKLIPVIQKTWRKMSEAGQKFALEIDYTVAQQSLIGKALQTSDSAKKPFTIE